MSYSKTYLTLILLFFLVPSLSWNHKSGDHGITIFTMVRNEFRDTPSYGHKVFLSYHGRAQDEFLVGKTYRSCQNIPKFEEDIDATSRTFYVSYYGVPHNTNPLKLYATMRPYGTHGNRIPLSVEPEIIQMDGKTPIKIRYDCSQIHGSDTHAVVELEVSNGESYQYLKQCNELPQMFWTHFMQFLALVKAAMTILLVGSKMGKLSLFERIDENRFDFYKISIKKVLLLIIVMSVFQVGTFYLLPLKWFTAISTVTLWVIALVLCLFLFMDFIDWIFGIEVEVGFEGSNHFMDQPCFWEGFNLKATISLFLSVLLVTLWYFLRHWTVSNILGIWVAWAIVKIFRFNALYPAFLILLGFLIFDVFWVFASPTIFNGHSIIHEVLRKIDFPLKLVVPGFSPFFPWANLSIIDIIVPTFYISFISRFGKEQGTNAYYLAHVMMYAISLGIFTFVMVYTKSQQPALMYIIPSLFLTTFITAGMRKEWGSKLSMSSVIEGEGYNPSDESSDKQPGEASARGMARFDPKQFNKTEDHQNFKKFEDDPADDVRDAEDGHAEFKEEVKESSQN